MKEIKLSQIVEALEMTDQNNNGYLHKETFKIVFISDDEFNELEKYEEREDLEELELPSWQLTSLEVTKDVAYSGNYYNLPSSFDIHEHFIMQKFCYTLEEGLDEECLSNIFRSGAFRNFKEFIHRNNLERDWYIFRYSKYVKIATDWLEINEINYLDDLERK